VRLASERRSLLFRHLGSSRKDFAAFFCKLLLLPLILQYALYLLSRSRPSLRTQSYIDKAAFRCVLVCISSACAAIVIHAGLWLRCGANNDQSAEIK